MKLWTHSASVRSMRQGIAAFAAVAALSLAMPAGAQTPAAKPATPAAKPAAAKPAAKPTVKPAAPATEQPAQTPPPAAAAQPPLPIQYSPWTKVCGKDSQPNAKESCLTIKEARLETGQFLVAVSLIEVEGEPRKVLRVTMPFGMLLAPGTRLIIDKDQPLSSPYAVCFANGCLSDYEVTPEFIAKLNKGQTMLIQGVNLAQQAATFPIPLTDFAKAHDGPPTDPKVLEEQQRKLQEELQRRAEEQRKKLQEQQQPPQPGAGAAASPPAAAPAK